MSGRRNGYRMRHCVSKRTFGSLEEATAAAMAASEEVLWGTPLGPYQCWLGRHWHIGHQWRGSFASLN